MLRAGRGKHGPDASRVGPALKVSLNVTGVSSSTDIKSLVSSSVLKISERG
jgi:hypothetical protein